MNTIYDKGPRNGWQATTYFPMGEAKDHFDRPAERRLRINTSKSSRGGISTFASCVLEREGIISFAIGGDYSKTVASESVRCTEKAVREQHQRALALAEQILADARTFYQVKDAEAEAQRQRRAAIERAPADQAQDEGQAVL